MSYEEFCEIISEGSLLLSCRQQGKIAGLSIHREIFAHQKSLAYTLDSLFDKSRELKLDLF